MAKKKSLFQEFTKGILVENPVLRLVLGTCPTLAVSTSVESALGMGVAASIVLVCSNIAISALKKVIPQKVRIPAYIVIIASFVTIVQMLVKAFVPQIDAQLGVYLPLIVSTVSSLAEPRRSPARTPLQPPPLTVSAWASASPQHCSSWAQSESCSARALLPDFR